MSSVYAGNTEKSIMQIICNVKLLYSTVIMIVNLEQIGDLHDDIT